MFVEGPYGVLTGARRARGASVTLIAGGIGITPLRALLESLPAGLASSPSSIARAIPTSSCSGRSSTRWPRTAARGCTTWSARGGGGPGDRMAGPSLDAATLARLVPGIAEHDVYLCGPTGLMDAVRPPSTSSACPAATSTSERFAY